MPCSLGRYHSTLGTSCPSKRPCWPVVHYHHAWREMEGKSWATCHLLTDNHHQPICCVHKLGAHCGAGAGSPFVPRSTSTPAVYSRHGFPWGTLSFCVHSLPPTHILSPHFQTKAGILNILGFIYWHKGWIEIFQKLFSFGKAFHWNQHFPTGKAQSGKVLKFWSSFQ